MTTFLSKALPPLLSCLAIATAGAASAQETKLPVGRYVYLGEDANTSTPKAFTISDDGMVVWQGDPPPKSALRAMPVEASHSTKPIAAVKPASVHASTTTATTGNIESIDYPLIKFRPKPIPGTKDGFAQLTTTLELPIMVTSSASTIGQVKFKLILLRAQPAYFVAELLDADGFRLQQFRVSSSDFQPVEGTDLLAARGQFTLDATQYSKVRDFALTPRSAQNFYSWHE